jgi:hypothetical protein
MRSPLRKGGDDANDGCVARRRHDGGRLVECQYRVTAFRVPSEGAHREDFMNRQRLCAMSAALVLLTGACATIQDRATTDSITLDKPVHFLSPDGNDIIAASGTYRIEALEGRALRMIPSEAVSGTTPLIVAAIALPHELPIESRVALSVPNGEDEHHIVLLLPDGKGLDAGGTYSAVRPRGWNPTPLLLELIEKALTQKEKPIRKDEKKGGH